MCRPTLLWILPLVFLIFCTVSESTRDRRESTCPEDEELCADQTRCVLKKWKCDGDFDCPDHSDEENCDKESAFQAPKPTSETAINECLLNNGGCSQVCVDDDEGFHCECHPGYQLHYSQSCEDIDECQIFGSCSQLCNNTVGSFKCSCLDGYSIEPSNSRRCKAQLGHRALLLITNKDLRKIDLETSEYSFITSHIHSSWDIEYDFKKELIIWNQIGHSRIYSANIEDAEFGTAIVYDAVSPIEDLAVDWIYGNVYWTGWYEIGVASLDGKLNKILFRHQPERHGREIVVNPLEGWMFWTDRIGESTTIERAGMDGSLRSTIVSQDIRFAHGLVIDFVTKKLYWSNGRRHSLRSSDYDGSNVRLILRSSLIIPHAVALDVFEDWLYWIDHRSGRICKVDKFTGENFQTVISGLWSPMALRVYHSYKQTTGPNYCGQENGQCSHFCLPAPHVGPDSSMYTCACPNGMVLTDNLKNCTVIESTTESLTTSTPSTTTISTTSATVENISSVLLSTQSENTEHSFLMNEHEDVESTSILTTSTSSTIAAVGTVSSVPSAESEKRHQMNETRHETQTGIYDSGKIVGIIIGVLGGLTVVISTVGFFIHKQYLRRNIKDKNFDNPVYCKTSEGVFILEKK